MRISGSKLAGGNPANDRVEYDFYATDPQAVNLILDNYDFNVKTILEPSVGQGHIAKTVSKYYDNKPQITGVDIVDRGYPNTIITDFLNWKTDMKFDGVIANPPYSLAGEFVEKSIKLLAENGKCLMFLKIKFLESAKRKELFDKYPPKYVYVFRNRMATWITEMNLALKEIIGLQQCATLGLYGKKGSTSEPIIRWLDNNSTSVTKKLF